MKKVTSISTPSKPAAAVPPAATAPIPTPVALELNEHESHHLRYLVLLQQQAQANVGDYVKLVLNNRKLDSSDWGISVANFKTINPLEKPPVAPASPATAPDPTK